jgi:hypothetical protein
VDAVMTLLISKVADGIDKGIDEPKMTTDDMLPIPTGEEDY